MLVATIAAASGPGSADSTAHLALSLALILDLSEVGIPSVVVALLGTLATFVLGVLVSVALSPGLPALVHAFVGASITATSVGITARVLKDSGRTKSREARIILGAAILDDIL